MNSVLQSDHLKVEGNWSLLWRLNIPPKVKHFLWRLLRDCLPTRQCLQQKGVNCTSLYSYCNTNIENAWHVMFGCDQVKRVWEVSGLWFIISNKILHVENLNQMIFIVFESLHTDLPPKFAMMCIWRWHNEWIWDNSNLEPSFLWTSLFNFTVNGCMQGNSATLIQQAST